MSKRRYFKEGGGTIDISAAKIGISKWDWVFVDGDNKEEAIKVMKENGFDVLPIRNTDSSFTHYYSTAEWGNFEHLNKLRIKDAPSIYYKTSFRDLVRRFREEDKFFYFLVDSSEVLGLVSFVNLNSLMVYNYLFRVIADIESSLFNLFRQELDEEKVIQRFENSSDKTLNKLAKEYKEEVDENQNNDFFQTLYFSNIEFLLKEFVGQLPPNKKKLARFAKNFNGENGAYCKIRNKVMHTTRRLLSDMESIDRIDKLLTDYDKIIEIVEG